MNERQYSGKVTQRIERLAGMRDVLPEEYARRAAAMAKIEKLVRAYGYKGIEVPIMERAELQLRKSGESMRRSMYFVRDQSEGVGGDEISLRPELTASIARLFNAELQSSPLPARLYYMGPAFRHDRPQHGRFREFTHVGVELVGAGGPDADAEIVAVARDVTEALGIRSYKILIGNIGVLIECLKSRPLQQKTRVRILEGLENVGTSDSKEDSLREMEGELLDTKGDIDESLALDTALVGALQRLKANGREDDVKGIISWVLRRVFGDRPGQDFGGQAEGLVEKLRAMEEKEHIPAVIDFIRRLLQIRGQPPAVFTEVKGLLKSYGLPYAPVDRLKAMTRYLDMYGIDWSRTEMDFGFGRGLAYYTGMVFEIHDDSASLGELQKQICGGGRYDDLIGELGGQQPVPALGFAFGLERLLLLKEASVPVQRVVPSVFVVPIGDDKEIEYAIATGSRLREAGVDVELCSAEIRPGRHTERANKLGVPYVVYLGEDERLSNRVTMRMMNTGEQKECSIEGVVDTVLTGGTE